MNELSIFVETTPHHLKNNSIDTLLSLSDSEMKPALEKGFFPLWVHEYVHYVISGSGNKEGDYTSTGDFENIFPSSLPTRRSVDRGFSRQRYH